MEEYLRFTKKALTDLGGFQKIHGILGNEACDLDSIVSAITYGCYLHSVHIQPEGETTLYLPIINIPSSQFNLRTEVKFFLQKLSLAADLLTFRDEVDLFSLKSEGKLILTLVDHNVLPPGDAILEDTVTMVIDHRALDRPESDRTEVLVDTVGSCCTLVCEHLLKNSLFNMDDETATLLYGTILVDTINRSAQAAKTTPRDEEILRELGQRLPDVNGDDLFNEIFKAKFDINGLTNREIFMKDVKTISNTNMKIEMISITMQLQVLLQRDNFVADLTSFCEARDANVAVIMTLAMDGSDVERQLAVYSENRIFRQQIADLLDNTSEPSLQLDPMLTTADSLLCFTQGNVPASRKQVLPILKSFLSGEATTPGIEDSGFNFDSQGNAPFTSIRESFNPDLPVDLSGHQENVPDNSDDPFGLFTSVGEVPVGQASSASNPFTNNGSSFDEFFTTAGNANHNQATADQSDDLGFDPFKSDLDENKDGVQSMDAFIDNLLNLNISSSAQQIVEQTKAERTNVEQTNTEAENFVNPKPDVASGQESPIDLSSGVPSGGSSYPVTPPNSFFESDMERFAKEHNLPSFNSSEMVKIIKDRQASMDHGESIPEEEGDGDTFPYTPRNSYQDSPMESSNQPHYDVPTFQSDDIMVQKIMEKRASLGGDTRDIGIPLYGGSSDEVVNPFYESISDEPVIGENRNENALSGLIEESKQDSSDSQYKIEAGENIVARNIAEEIKSSDPFASDFDSEAETKPFGGLVENAVAENLAKDMKRTDPFEPAYDAEESSKRKSDEEQEQVASDFDSDFSSENSAMQNMTQEIQSDSQIVVAQNLAHKSKQSDPFVAEPEISNTNAVAQNLAQEMQQRDPFDIEPEISSPNAVAQSLARQMQQRDPFDIEPEMSSQNAVAQSLAQEMHQRDPFGIENAVAQEMQGNDSFGIESEISSKNAVAQNMAQEMQQTDPFDFAFKRSLTDGAAADDVINAAFSDKNVSNANENIWNSESNDTGNLSEMKSGFGDDFNPSSFQEGNFVAEMKSSNPFGDQPLGNVKREPSVENVQDFLPEVERTVLTPDEISRSPSKEFGATGDVSGIDAMFGFGKIEETSGSVPSLNVEEMAEKIIQHNIEEEYLEGVDRLPEGELDQNQPTVAGELSAEFETGQENVTDQLQSGLDNPGYKSFDQSAIETEEDISTLESAGLGDISEEEVRTEDIPNLESAEEVRTEDISNLESEELDISEEEVRTEDISAASVERERNVVAEHIVEGIKSGGLLFDFNDDSENLDAGVIQADVKVDAGNANTGVRFAGVTDIELESHAEDLSKESSLKPPTKSGVRLGTSLSVESGNESEDIMLSDDESFEEGYQGIPSENTSEVQLAQKFAEDIISEACEIVAKDDSSGVLAAAAPKVVSAESSSPRGLSRSDLARQMMEGEEFDSSESSAAATPSSDLSPVEPQLNMEETVTPSSDLSPVEPQLNMEETVTPSSDLSPVEPQLNMEETVTPSSDLSPVEPQLNMEDSSSETEQTTGFYAVTKDIESVNESILASSVSKELTSTEGVSDDGMSDNNISTQQENETSVNEDISLKVTDYSLEEADNNVNSLQTNAELTVTEDSSSLATEEQTDRDISEEVKAEDISNLKSADLGDISEEEVRAEDIANLESAELGDISEEEVRAEDIANLESAGLGDILEEEVRAVDIPNLELAEEEEVRAEDIPNLELADLGDISEEEVRAEDIPILESAEDISNRESEELGIAQKIADTAVSEAIERLTKEHENIAEEIADAMVESESDIKSSDKDEDNLASESFIQTTDISRVESVVGGNNTNIDATEEKTDKSSSDFQTDTFSPDLLDDDVVKVESNLDEWDDVAKDVQPESAILADNAIDVETDKAIVSVTEESNKDLGFTDISSDREEIGFTDLSPDREEIVQEIAYDMADDIIQKALDTFSADEDESSSLPSPDTSPNMDGHPFEAHMKRSHEMCPIKSEETPGMPEHDITLQKSSETPGHDFTLQEASETPDHDFTFQEASETPDHDFTLPLETEYLPNVDPLRGNLDIVTSPGQTVSTDASKELPENIGFKQMSTEQFHSSPSDESAEDLSSFHEDNTEEGAELSSPIEEFSEKSSVEAPISAIQTENAFSEQREEPSAIEEEHVSGLQSINVIEGNDSAISSNKDVESSSDYSKTMQGNIESDISQIISESKDVETEFSESVSHEETSTKNKSSDALSVPLTGKQKKEVYMTTAGRISISTDTAAESDADTAGSFKGSPISGMIAEESRQQTGEILTRTENVIVQVDDKLAEASVISADKSRSDDITDEDFLSKKTTSALAEAMEDVDMEDKEHAEIGSRVVPIETEIKLRQDSESSDTITKSEIGSRVVPIETEVKHREDSESSHTISKSARPSTLPPFTDHPKQKIHPNIKVFAGEESDVEVDDEDNDSSLCSSDPDYMSNVDDLATPDIATPDTLIGESDWESRSHCREDTPVASPAAEAIPEYTAAEESRDEKSWRRVTIGDQEFTIDMKVVEPYKRVLSHGGYYGEGNAVVVFSGCYLPDRSRKDYSYVMENLFFYVISTLELLVAEDYMIVYFHGATPSRQMPSFSWLKRCYQMIDRRLKKNLKGLLLVHPTLWIKTVVLMSRPFISSKFKSKLRMVKNLAELESFVPMEYVFVPDQVRHVDKCIAVNPKLLEKGFDGDDALTTINTNSARTSKKKKSSFWKRK